MNNLTRHNIVVAGACNSGKSSLVNALTGHRSALVSDVAGTTTDPSRFLMEIPGAGPCRIIDTPGADDSDSKLGKERVTLAYKSLEEADLILRLIEAAKPVSFSEANEVVKIINEEAEGYYLGQKTAEEVMEIIQNRVRIYVNEK